MFLSAVMRPRAGGKSTKLAEMARQNPDALIVVTNLAAARRFSVELHVPAKQVVLLSAILNGCWRGRNHIGLLLFDDFEYTLQQLMQVVGIGSNIGAIVIAATGSQL